MKSSIFELLQSSGLKKQRDKTKYTGKTENKYSSTIAASKYVYWKWKTQRFPSILLSPFYTHNTTHLETENNDHKRTL